MNLDYVAGFLDGEGMAKIYDGRKPVITITNNDRNVLSEIQRFLGCGKLYPKGLRKHAVNPCYELHFKRVEDCLKVADLLAPRCFVKREALLEVSSTLRRLGVRGKRLYKRGPISREILTTLYLEQGLSGRRIAAELGCSNPKVYAWLVRYGIPRRRPGP